MQSDCSYNNLKHRVSMFTVEVGSRRNQFWETHINKKVRFRFMNNISVNIWYIWQLSNI